MRCIINIGLDQFGFMYSWLGKIVLNDNLVSFISVVIY